MLGMRGTGDWGPNQRPQSYRESLLYLYPNGQLTLTGMTAMMPSEQVTDPTFHWWTKDLPRQYGPIVEQYSDALMSAAYVSGGQTGDVIYVKVSADTVRHFRPGHVAMLRKAGDYRHDVRGKVLHVQKAGTQSMVALRLLHAASATFDLGATTDITIIGNMNAEGATMPESISYNPVQYSSKTQIFRTSLGMTRTALRTKLRTYDQYKEAKREALELHGIEMEKSFIWGRAFEGIGSNGKPERATNGIVTAILENVPENVDAYHLNPAFASKTWALGGEDWIDTMMERIFRYGGGGEAKMAIVGSGTVLALKKLAKAGASYDMKMGEISYGIKVVEWMTPFGTVYLKTHPLFSHDPATRNDMLILEPRNLRTRYIDDTFFVSDPEDRRNRNHSKDGREEEFITEIGLEYHNLSTFGYLSGFGLNNALV